MARARDPVDSGLPWPQRVALWDRALAAVRDYLRQAGHREVSTAIRVAAVALEPFIEPLRAPPGYLATSPELGMKRLLCRGSGPIYQLSHVFRAAERGARHREEFHLLEWYRPGATLAEARGDVEALVAAVFAAAGRPPLPPWSTFALLEVMEATAGLRLRGDEGADELAIQARAHHLPLTLPEIGGDMAGVAELAAWSALLSEWSDRHLDPWLAARGGGVHLVDFPPALAALAVIHRTPAGLRAQRFESFVDGVELANGYHELGDATEQRRRFAVVAGLRRALGLDPLAVDHGFLDDLVGYGLPDCAGVALGLDRLVMLAAGTDRLDPISLALGSV